MNKKYQHPISLLLLKIQMRGEFISYDQRLVFRAIFMRMHSNIGAIGRAMSLVRLLDPGKKSQEVVCRWCALGIA